MWELGNKGEPGALKSSDIHDTTISSPVFCSNIFNQLDWIEMKIDVKTIPVVKFT